MISKMSSPTIPATMTYEDNCHNSEKHNNIALLRCLFSLFLGKPQLIGHLLAV
jgi:hypothetical protein